MSNSKAKDKLRVERLAECEARIDRAALSFLEAGQALLEVHDEQLWVGAYASFDAYVERRWGWDGSYGYRLMKAAEVSRAVSPLVEAGFSQQIPSEHVANALAPLLKSPDRLVALWKVVGAANRPRPRAKVVTAALRSLKGVAHDGPEGLFEARLNDALEACEVDESAARLSWPSESSTPRAGDARDFLRAIELLAAADANVIFEQITQADLPRLRSVRRAFHTLMRLNRLAAGLGAQEDPAHG